MGRTPTPLVVWTTAEWAKRPEMVELAEKGHAIVEIEQIQRWMLDSLEPVPEPDLILHPAAHGWTEQMWETRLLDVALSAARRRKKATMPPLEPKRKKKGA